MKTGEYIKDVWTSHNSNQKKGKFILSHLHSYEKHTSISPFSIKIVLEGTEQYQVNQRRFKVQRHQFIVVNEGDQLITEVNHSNTKGICFYPDHELVRSVYQYLTQNDHQLLENFTSTDDTPHFTTHLQSTAQAFHCSQFLEQQIPAILTSIHQQEKVPFTSFFESLISSLIMDQHAREIQLKNLPSSKKQTREELYRRLLLAKEYIHDNIVERINIEDIMAISCLSRYHLIRSFKQLYGCSPYQYILREKLILAQQLLGRGYSYTEVCERINFSDAKNLKRAQKRDRRGTI